MKVEVHQRFQSTLPADDTHPYRTGAWRPQTVEYDAWDLDLVEGEIVRGYGRQVDAEFGTQTFHPGVVFDARHGTPVEAVAPGRVRFAGWFRGYGRLVILDHGEGYFTVTGHLDAFDVAVGDTVARRQRIGRVGETGSLSGPRVYFEVRRGGEALDPADWLQ